MNKYDILIVGAGLFGSTYANLAKETGKKCLVIDKRSHIGGNMYTEKIEGINVHKYGPHIFHTSNRKVWDYVNKFATFNNYVNKSIANYNGELYSLPFNMYTFNKMWGLNTPAETLASNCYSGMFGGCSKLNYIKALFTTEPSTSYTQNWVSGVASSGTFIKNPAATWNVTGVNGIPTGWTVTTNVLPQ